MKLKIETERTAVWDPGEGLDPVTFKVRPATVLDGLELQEQLVGLGPLIEVGGATSTQLGETRQRLSRLIDISARSVVGWDGVIGGDDAPLACTADAVRALLARYPAALEVVRSAAFGAPKDPDRPNGSGAGSDVASPGPISPVASTETPTAVVTAATTSTA